MIELRALIAEAALLGGDNLCAAGHAWESDGGRACALGDGNCSQAVYRCTRCGEWDYGEPGGPGAEDCARCAGLVRVREIAGD